MLKISIFPDILIRIGKNDIIDYVTSGIPLERKFDAD